MNHFKYQHFFYKGYTTKLYAKLANASKYLKWS